MSRDGPLATSVRFDSPYEDAASDRREPQLASPCKFPIRQFDLDARRDPQFSLALTPNTSEHRVQR